jgi:hypothetical protein
VQACLDWYRRHMPGQERMLERMLDADANATGEAHAIASGAIAMLLQGFEAGREFEREHPEVEPGIGYLPNGYAAPPRRP